MIWKIERGDFVQFANILKTLMEKKGVTNYRLSKDIDCAPTTVTNWLTGKTVPASDKMQLLAGYFGVSVDYLMTGDDEDTAERYEQQEVADMLDEIRKNPELRTMFSITRNATPEQLRQYINVIKAIRGED